MGFFTPINQNEEIASLSRLTSNYPVANTRYRSLTGPYSDIRDTSALPEFSFWPGRHLTTWKTDVWASEQWKMEGNKGKENSTKDTGKEKWQDRIAQFKKLREKKRTHSAAMWKSNSKGQRPKVEGGQHSSVHTRQGQQWGLRLGRGGTDMGTRGSRT